MKAESANPKRKRSMPAANVNPETEADRVRRYTSPEILREIEDRIEHNIRLYAAQPREVIARRIEELEREWSIERYLQVKVSTVAFSTAVLGLVGKRKWVLLTCGALGFFLYHGLRGFDAPIPLLRRLGVRTRSEIDRELFALKALRGDFKDLPQPKRKREDFPARQVLDAVNA